MHCSETGQTSCKIIINRCRDFVSTKTLDLMNHELLSTAGWIYRTNFWRYYLIDGLRPYDENCRDSWYHHQPAMSTMPQPWADLFDQVTHLAGPRFEIMRYALTGQTQGQHQTFHRDVSQAQQGRFRTYLLYLNSKWNPDQGGSTDFMLSDDTVSQEWPEPGKLIEYDSKILHCGQPPTVPNVLRISLAIHGRLG